jgi:hypothetical protein
MIQPNNGERACNDKLQAIISMATPISIITIPSSRVIIDFKRNERVTTLSPINHTIHQKDSSVSRHHSLVNLIEYFDINLFLCKIFN